MTKLYGFTVKYNGIAYPTQEDYLPILKAFSSKGTIIDFVYETDKKGKLHIHGMLEVTRCPYFKNMIPKKCHIKYEEIYDKSGWERYIHKQSGNDSESQQLVDAVYCRRNYIF